MSAGYGVHTDALTNYAAKIDKAADRITEIMRSLGTIQIPENAFGKLPDAHGLYQAYHEHAEADVDNCRDLADILQHTADGLRHSAQAYDDNEIETVSSMQGVQL